MAMDWRNGRQELSGFVYLRISAVDRAHNLL